MFGFPMTYTSRAIMRLIAFIVCSVFGLGAYILWSANVEARQRQQRNGEMRELQFVYEDLKKSGAALPQGKWMFLKEVSIRMPDSRLRVTGRVFGRQTSTSETVVILVSESSSLRKAGILPFRGTSELVRYDPTNGVLSLGITTLSE